MQLLDHLGGDLEQLHARERRRRAHDPVAVTATNAGGSSRHLRADRDRIGAGSVLVGNQQVQSYADSNPAGMAQAFSYTASASGTTTDIELYVNTGTTATKVVLGVYSNSGGKPGSLLASGSITSPQAGAWNDVSLAEPRSLRERPTGSRSFRPAGNSTITTPPANPPPPRATSTANRGMSSLPNSYASGNEWNASPASGLRQRPDRDREHPPVEYGAPRGLGYRPAGRHADHDERLVDGQPDVVRLSVAGLQHLGC